MRTPGHGGESRSGGRSLTAAEQARAVRAVRRTAKEQGQALVVFALTLLLLTLMVLITLQLGMRAREKIEAQMVADTAAYSEAIATARTYNMVAVMNRARVAHYVALLGTESLVSWAGLIRGSADNVAAALDACGAAAAAAALRTSAAAADPAWEVADDDSGDQARDHQGQAGRIRAATRDYYATQLMAGQLQGQALADRIARLANPELRAPPTGDAKSMAEVDPNCTTGAACTSGDGRAVLSGIMGSRGWVFTTDRAAATTARGTGTLASVVNSAGGGSGFGDDPWFGVSPTGTQPPAERAQIFELMDGEGAWAEDHGGSATIQIAGCTAPATVSSAFVMSSVREVVTDRHTYAGVDVGRPESVRHTLLSCPPAIPGCPAVVGGHLAFNRSLLGQQANDHGQPKLYAMIERDYSRRTFDDPWSILFDFQFVRGGPGWRFDNGNRAGDWLTPGGANISRQVAVGAGIAYYHRPLINGGGGFQEPPNFWNPFWRATLAPPDRDVGDRLDAAGYPETKAVYDLLRARGYRGVP